MNRRNVLKLSGAGLGAALMGGGKSCCSPEERSGILKPGDKVNLKCDPEDIIQKAYELGFKYEKINGGCARCTVAALQDAVPFVTISEELFRGSTSVDGGATPTGIQSCGAFTGAGMIIAYTCGSTRVGERFSGDTKLAHALMYKLHDQFVKKYGSVLCADIREVMDENCMEVVGLSAQWAAEVLISEFE